MIHRLDELGALARTFLDATPGMTATGLSLIITGTKNEKLIARILRGQQCLMRQGEMASRYFAENWPDGVPWPSGIERPTGCEKENAGS